MRTMTFTEFRKHASEILGDVEKGESIDILRHGRVIARIVPAATSSIPSWKRTREVLTVKGISLSKTIVDERRQSEA